MEAFEPMVLAAKNAGIKRFIYVDAYDSETVAYADLFDAPLPLSALQMSSLGAALDEEKALGAKIDALMAEWEALESELAALTSELEGIERARQKG